MLREAKTAALIRQPQSRFAQRRPRGTRSVPRVKRRLEVELCSKLISPGIRDSAASLSEIHVLRGASVAAAEVVMVERVENIERNSESRRALAETREVLTQPHVYVLVRERAGNAKSTHGAAVIRCLVCQ